MKRYDPGVPVAGPTVALSAPALRSGPSDQGAPIANAPTRKLIFLDMDGVIATPRVVKDGLWAIDPQCEEELGRIISATGAELVISSSWRKHTIAETVDFLNEQGFRFCDRIVGVTIRGYHYLVKGAAISIPRGVEIKQWIDHNIHSGGNGEYVLGRNGTFNRRFLGVDFEYVILDDDSDMLLEQASHFVRCEWDIGLTRELADKAIGILRVSNRIDTPDNP